MDIKNKLRTALMEGKHKTHKNEFGCVMIYMDADKKKWSAMQDLIDDEDLYLPPDDPHATILFGLHGDVPDADVETEIEKIKTPKIELGGISTFKNDKFEVLKFDIDSPDLHELNKKFKKFPYTNAYPDYHPHMTIAYLKPNKADKYVKMLKDSTDIEMTPNHIVYSKVDGDKKTYDLK